MVSALQHEHTRRSVIQFKFAKGQHNAFWLAAGQKAFALDFGHSQKWTKYGPKAAQVIIQSTLP